MAPDKLADTVFVFDLDDTLYAEEDYVRSGIAHLCERLERLLGRNFYSRIMEAFLGGEKDWLSLLCGEAGLTSVAKESLLWMYRLHTPAIQLSPSCAHMLEEVQRHSKDVLILTDGRSLTQRLKVDALGLSHIPLFISEDYGSVKPDPLRFQLIEHDYPAVRHVYIGDNPKKDFYAGNALGWLTVGVRPTRGNIHSYDLACLEKDAIPQLWIDDWEGFLDKLC